MAVEDEFARVVQGQEQVQNVVISYSQKKFLCIPVIYSIIVFHILRRQYMYYAVRYSIICSIDYSLQVL